MGNQHGWMCYNCGSQDDLYVIATAKYQLVGDGAIPDEDDGDVEYNANSYAGCKRCGWHGLAGEFIEVAPGDQSLGSDDIDSALWFPSEGWALMKVEEDFDEHIEAVSTDEFCDNGIVLTQREAKERAQEIGFIFEDDEFPYKPTGFKVWRSK